MHKRSIIAIILMVALMAVNTMGVSANNYNSTLAGSRAVAFFKGVQNDDGGFPSSPGRNSDIDTTSWAIMALEAVGEDVTSASWRKNGNTPVTYLMNHSFVLEDTTDYAKMLLVLSAADSGHSYKGENLLETIKGFQQPDGAFFQPDLGEEGMINAHMWSVLAIASTGSVIPNQAKAKGWLIDSQNDDGGFSWFMGVESDSDDTAAAIQALLILGEEKDSEVLNDAKTFLKTCQNEDGGFKSGDMMGPDSNAASDAWVLQALEALEEDYRGTQWKKGGKDVKNHIFSLQQSDGSYVWKEDVDASRVKMTAYVLTALSGKPYPVNIDYSKLGVESTFKDVEAGYWAAEAIEELVALGVLNGYEDGTFKPDNSVTRAEFTAMLIKGFNLIDETYASNGFTDIPGSHWALPFISIAYDQGYINGRSESVFDPGGNISGAELATIAVNTMAEEDKAATVQGPYWYSANVAIAEKANLLYSDFVAGEEATRAQCAYVVSQLLGNR